MTSFATILKRALHERDITASDLARRIWGEGDERNGARNRQIISLYLAGKTQPRLATQERIAAAFQMPVADLEPSLALPDKLSIEADSLDDKVMLRINRRVDHATAMKIIGMLSA